MGKKSITKNYIYNLVYQILVIILPLITVPYISRVVGAEGIGIYSYTISITLYFITFGSLGIALYGQREIAFNQDDKKKYSKIFYEINILRFITLSISLLLFYFVFVFRNNQYHLYYMILLLEIIASMLDISWFFQGHEDFKRTVLRNILVKLLSIILIFIFVKSSKDLWLYILIYVLSVFIGNISLWLYLPKYLIKVNFKELNIKQHIKPTIGLFIPQIAIQVYTLLDKTMIGTIISDKSEVGFYDQAQKIIKLLLTIITSFGTVMMPRIAYTYSKGDRKKIEKYLYNSFNLVFILAIPMIAGTFLIADAFVPFFFGKGYERVSLLMKVISPILLFIGMSNVTGTQYLLPIKRQREFTISVVIGAITNFVLNVLLIPKYGALGATIATVIAEFSVTFVQLILVKKEIKIYDIIKLCYRYIIAATLMFAVGMVINNYISNNLLSIIVQIILSPIIYFGILILLKDKFIFEGINMIKCKFFKGKA